MMVNIFYFLNDSGLSEEALLVERVSEEKKEGRQKARQEGRKEGKSSNFHYS